MFFWLWHSRIVQECVSLHAPIKREKLLKLLTFMYGQDAHPPLIEHPSPLATPGITGSMTSPILTGLRPEEELVDVLVIESDETGNTISTLIFAPPDFAEPNKLRTNATIEVTIPDSVPNTN